MQSLFMGTGKGVWFVFYVMWHGQKRGDEINLGLEKNRNFANRDEADEMIFRDYGSCLFYVVFNY